jgi:hypothetical protein
MPWGIMQWGTTSTTGHTIDEATRVRQREWLAARAAPRWRLAALSFAGAWVVSVVAASWLLLRPEPEPNYWIDAPVIDGGARCTPTQAGAMLYEDNTADGRPGHLRYCDGHAWVYLDQNPVFTVHKGAE